MNILISKWHKKSDGSLLHWVHPISVSDSAGTVFDVDGVKVFKTERNYYYGASSDNKIHYTHMSTEGSNAKHMYEVYFQLKNGVFWSAGLMTDITWESNFEIYFQRALSFDDIKIDNWTKELVFVNSKYDVSILPSISHCYAKYNLQNAAEMVANAFYFDEVIKPASFIDLQEHLKKTITNSSFAWHTGYKALELFTAFCENRDIKDVAIA